MILTNTTTNTDPNTSLTLVQHQAATTQPTHPQEVMVTVGDTNTITIMIQMLTLTAQAVHPLTGKGLMIENHPIVNDIHIK